MWNWDSEKNESAFAACATGEDFKKHIDIIHDDFFVACLDLGHAEMRGSGDGAVNMIRTLRSRLQALHIHDTDFVDDCHTMPYMQKLDWESIVAALAKIGYTGDCTAVA